MNSTEFSKYLQVLQQKPFALYPEMEVPPSQVAEWSEKKFIFVSDSQTHVTIEDAQTKRQYLIPLALVEFANPGVLRLTRALKPWNGGFV